MLTEGGGIYYMLCYQVTQIALSTAQLSFMAAKQGNLRLTKKLSNMSQVTQPKKREHTFYIIKDILQLQDSILLFLKFVYT